jgi:prepilin-type N-terminal cleavage/methylation domain-containing protein
MVVLLNKRPNEKGFTLTELLVVIGIAVAMAGLSYSGFTTWEKKERTREAAYELVSQLKVARMLALEKGVSHVMLFDNTTDPNHPSYWVFRDLNGDRILDATEPVMFQIDLSVGHRGTTISTNPVGLADRGTVQFDTKGMVTLRDKNGSQLATDCLITFNRTDGSGFVSGWEPTVTVSPLGRITLVIQKQ